MATCVLDGPPGMYQCGICKKDYKRLDHLSRHTRTHALSRPHKCHLCPKTFTRTDLLKRHLAAHERQNSKLTRASTSGSSSFQGVPELGRVSQACETCSVNHLRCTEEKPCSRCLSKGIQCIWDRGMKSGEQVFTPPASEGYRPQEQIPSPASAHGPLTAQSDQWHGASATHPSLCNDNNPDDGMMLDLGVSTPTFAGWPFVDNFPSLNLLSAQWSGVIGGGLVDVDVDTSGPFADIQYPLPDYLNVMGFDYSQGGFQDFVRPVDTSVAAYDATTPSALRKNVSGTAGDPDDDPGQPADMCTEAFRNSHWHFRPGTKDNAGADDHNLSLPRDSDFDSPDSNIKTTMTTAEHTLTVATRDRILLMVVKHVDPDHLPKAVACFPSAQLLGSLVQIYLRSPTSQAASFLHAPTFNPSTQRPELLAAMAAGGAILTSDPVLVKVGYAIAEVTRIAIAGQWERNNATIRDLQLLQAFFIILELGIWSGHGRRVEIAESFLQILVTMLRRGGYFRLATYTHPSSTLVDGASGEEEEDVKWQAWIKEESFKRIVFRVLQHDTSSSIALLVNPIISYTELQLPLPESNTLWSAPTNSSWQELYSTQENRTIVIVGDLMNDPGILCREETTIDKVIASRALISLLWMLTWEYTRMTSFQKTQPRQLNALVTKLRLDELQKLLDTVTISLAAEIDSNPILAIHIEVVHLYLHISFEDIQAFAGMQGAEQARAVFPSIQDWSLSESARRAVFHAARVISASRKLPQTSIQGVEAIMIYHAGLTLWVYGLLGGRNPATTGLRDVYLDSASKDTTLRRFLEFGSGKPCLDLVDYQIDGDQAVADSARIPLDQPDAVLEAIIVIIQRNFETTEMPCLMQKLMQLMHELSKAAKRYMMGVERC